MSWGEGNTKPFFFLSSCFSTTQQTHEPCKPRGQRRRTGLRRGRAPRRGPRCRGRAREEAEVVSAEEAVREVVEVDRRRCLLRRSLPRRWRLA